MSARSKKKTAKFLWIILIIPLLVGGFITQKNGYQKVREMRQLERIPETDVIAVIPGEISMRGSATDWKSTENTNEEISLSRLIEEQEALDLQIANQRAIYIEKFTAMETAVSSFKKTGEFLDNLIKSWNSSN